MQGVVCDVKCNDNDVCAYQFMCLSIHQGNPNEISCCGTKSKLHQLVFLMLRVLHLISIHKYLYLQSTQRIYQMAYKQSFYPVPKLCKIQILVSSCLSINQLNQQFFKKFLSADAHRSLKISNFHKELSLLSLKVLNCAAEI